MRRAAAGPARRADLEPVIVDVGTNDEGHAPEEGESVMSCAPPSVVANVGMLSRQNLERAEAVRRKFDAADPMEVGERLLQDLVAAEVGVAFQLVDVEAGLVALLSRTIADPAMALAVARTFREAAALSSAVRRRMENCLAAAATLRAQRLLAGTRRDDGD